MRCVYVKQEITNRLLKFYTLEEAFKWLHSPHPQLDGRTPVGAMADDREDEVTAIIDRLEADAYL